MLRKNVLAALVSTLTWFGYIHSAYAGPIQYPPISDEPMSFQLVTLSNADIRELGPWSDLVRGGNRSLILASGQIFGEGQKPGVNATSETFRAFLASHYISPGTLLMMSSGGGNLFDSFLIGEQIRQAGLRTSVIPGAICASACNFMFMGGTVRTIPADSTFWVHRFAPFASQQVDEREAEENAQMQSGYIATYLKEMDIDSDFLVLMSQIENEKPQVISADLLRQLRVLNAGAVTKWQEGSMKGVFYVEALTSKSDGNGVADHLGLLCDSGKLYLRAVYFPHATDYVRPLGIATVDPDPSGILPESPFVKMMRQELEEYPLWDVTTSSLVNMTYAVTLENFPNAPIDINKSVVTLVESKDHRSVIALVDLNQNLWDLIMKSNGIGFGFLISSHGQARASVSFHTSIDAEGKDKLQSFVTGCGGLKR